MEVKFNPKTQQMLQKLQKEIDALVAQQRVIIAVAMQELNVDAKAVKLLPEFAGVEVPGDGGGIKDGA